LERSVPFFLLGFEGGGGARSSRSPEASEGGGRDGATGAIFKERREETSRWMLIGRSEVEGRVVELLERDSFGLGLYI
jgi:hypothetical protein